MRFLSALFGFLFFVAALTFALSNQQSVTVSLWPFGYEMATPVYVLVLGPLLIGLLGGGSFVWLTSLRHRIRARKLGKSVAVMSDKIEEMEEELGRHRALANETTPPLLTGPKWRFWERS